MSALTQTIVAEEIDPPYPYDTRAKGWRFELDYERIRQSDTWALAAPAQRPWLLMLWMSAWEQTPCGTLPHDPELIAARIGMPLPEFMANERVLLRGWESAKDGRLYHPVITQQVLTMLAAKQREATRKAGYRQRVSHGQPPPSASVPVVSHGTDAGPPGDSGGTPPGIPPESATGTGTSTSTSTAKEKTVALPRSLTLGDLVSTGVTEAVAVEFMAMRKRKRAPLTERAWAGIEREIRKAGWSVQDALEKCLARGWQGFEADWVRGEKPQKTVITSQPNDAERYSWAGVKS